MCATHPIMPNKYRGTTTYHKVFYKLIYVALAQQPVIAEYQQILGVYNAVPWRGDIVFAQPVWLAAAGFPGVIIGDFA